jgi:UDP-N-acetylmuramyl pentapeptide phosphotransferase/UDP-N-acetylglucosamine-1-phosphate transferase
VYIEALCAAVISVLLTFSIRQICIRHAWVASPVGDRLQHPPTPRFGGIAIVASFGIVCAGMQIWHHQRFTVILLAGLGIFALGLADDIWQISPGLKLCAQVVLSAIPVVFGVRIPLTHLPLVNAAVTILWFVGITNAFNLLDNMNGLSAGIAIIVGLFRGSISLLQNDHVGFVLCITLAAAVLGFLIFNFPRGLIFMGDGGALFLGFVLAGLAFTGTYAYLKSYLDLLSLPVVLMLVPICDTTFVTVVRLLCGRPVSRGGRDHLSHSLVANGLTPVVAVVTLWLVCVACGAISLVGTMYGSARVQTLILILLGGVIATISYLTGYQVVSAAVGEDKRVYERLADVLASSASMAEVCQTLRGCLERAGFDGISLYLDSGIPAAVPLQPFTRNDQGELEFLWNSSLALSETKWSMSFSLHPKHGAWQGRCTLHPNVSGRPMLMDLSLFTSSGFSAALAEGLDCAIRKHTILNDRAEPSRAAALLGAAAGADGAYLGKVS